MQHFRVFLIINVIFLVGQYRFTRKCLSLKTVMCVTDFAQGILKLGVSECAMCISKGPYRCIENVAKGDLMIL